MSATASTWFTYHEAAGFVPAPADAGPCDVYDRISIRGIAVDGEEAGFDAATIAHAQAWVAAQGGGGLMAATSPTPTEAAKIRAAVTRAERFCPREKAISLVAMNSRFSIAQVRDALAEDA